jgi:RNA polymerase sigma-70 factor (ECF subfamily)
VERAAGQHQPAAAAADEAVVAREEVDTVLGALARLADADRLAIALRYLAELPDAEAAPLAGATPSAFRVRVLRARRRLEALLEEADG